MSGGIVQLVATGVQDEWLTGKPEISFFRSNYKRYTHYSSSVERQTIQGTPSAGNISTVRLEKKGDLVSYMYLTARDGNNALVANLDWSQVISRIQLFIGGQEIDSQDFQWMSDVEPVVGGANYNQRYLNNQANPSASQNTNQVASFFPLKFFFNKDWMVSLPLVALAFHDVEIRITWAPNSGSLTTAGTAGGITPTGSITGNLLTLTAGVYNIIPGQQLSGSSISTTCTVLSIISGTGNSGTSVFLLSAVQANVASSTLNITTANQTFSPTNGLGAPTWISGASGSTVVSSGTTLLPNSPTYSQLSYQLWTNFIYLDAEERDFFAKTPMDVLMTQVQRVPVGQTAVQEIALAHPIKYIAFQSNNYNVMYSTNGYPAVSPVLTGGSTSSTAMFATLRTQINGSDVGEDKSLAQYTDIPQYYHTQVGYVTTPSGTFNIANVAIINYCLDTTKLQPTGTLNFSRLDTYRLVTPTLLNLGGPAGTGMAALSQPPSQLRGHPGATYLYAVNYNILRIQKGMGGLLYAN
jgi:hypothetical protein